MRRWLLFALMAVVGIGVILGGVAFYLARRGLPNLEATVATHVSAEVLIYRDEYGIPHVQADNLEDLLYAQGYTQAQDRLWQMDLSRRAVAGRLSEIFGADFIEADFFLRSLLMRHAAEQGAELLDPKTRKLLMAYASGVNAYIEECGKALPPEFTLLGYTPESWTVQDSLSIGKYMAWDLGGNMDTELFLVAALDRLPREKALELFPSYPDEGPNIMPKEAVTNGEGTPPGLETALALLQRIALIRQGVPGQELGSNNWVVGGAMTTSNKPLLANDMHLSMGIPSIWYQTRLEIPGQLTLSGVIFPGIPGIIVGSNGHVAWGVTNVGPDVQDLYMERQHPDNPYLFQFDGEWEEAQVLKEQIFVKGQDDPIEKEILITRNGPILSPVLDEPGEVLSLRWTAHDHTREIDAVLSFMEARSWEEFKEGMELFHVPAQNFVFADLKGNIGYRANGRIPIRGKGDGLLPAPGWDPDYQWQGYIPYDQLPTLYNPEEGYIVTANNKVADDDYPYFISSGWAPPYRAMAIREGLEGRAGLSVEDMQALQQNVDNLQAVWLLPLLFDALAQEPLSDMENQALDILRQWGEDPQDKVDEAGASIYHSVYLKALEETFKEEMGEELYSRFFGGSVVNTFDRMLQEGSIWLSEAEGGREGVLTRAFTSAVTELMENLGGAPESWTWGRLHQIQLEHNLSQIPGVGRLLNDGPHPLPGSHLTVAAASYRFAEPFMTQSSAPWRYVADLADLGGNSWENLAGGVSGHPLSSHYRDQTPLWLEGTYTPVYLFAEQIKEANVRKSYLECID